MVESFTDECVNMCVIVFSQLTAREIAWVYSASLNTSQFVLSVVPSQLKLVTLYICILYAYLFHAENTSHISYSKQTQKSFFILTLRLLQTIFQYCQLIAGGNLWPASKSQHGLTLYNTVSNHVLSTINLFPEKTRKIPIFHMNQIQTAVKKNICKIFSKAR